MAWHDGVSEMNRNVNISSWLLSAGCDRLRLRLEISATLSGKPCWKKPIISGKCCRKLQTRIRHKRTAGGAIPAAAPAAAAARRGAGSSPPARAGWIRAHFEAQLIGFASRGFAGKSYMSQPCHLLGVALAQPVLGRFVDLVAHRPLDVPAGRGALSAQGARDRGFGVFC